MGWEIRKKGNDFEVVSTMFILLLERFMTYNVPQWFIDIVNMHYLDGNISFETDEENDTLTIKEGGTCIHKANTLTFSLDGVALLNAEIEYDSPFLNEYKKIMRNVEINKILNNE